MIELRASDYNITYDRDKKMWLSLKIDRDLSQDQINELTNDMTIKIDKHKQKRSLDANAYAWVLIHKLSSATGISPLEIYRDACRNVVGASTVICVRDKECESVCKCWQKNGIGWQTETFKSAIDGCTNIILTMGSSMYSQKQMAQLLDEIITQCKDYNIETMTPTEINRLKELWSD